jgi:ABC-2 type transport system permease protein
MRAILWWGLWERKWSMLWWSVGIAVYILINLSVYKTIQGSQEQLNQALQTLPTAAKALFTQTGSFLTPVGYLDSKIYYLILPMLLGILAIGLGSSLLSKEEQSGTLELLLARPMSRTKLLTSKLAVGLIVIVVVGLAVLVVTALSAKAFGIVVPTRYVVAVTILAVLLSVLFGTISFAFSAIGGLGRGASSGIAAFLLLAGYVASSFEGLVHWLRWPAKLLPYHYYQTSAVLTGTYNWWNATYFVVGIAVFVLLAFIGFRRRDIG